MINSKKVMALQMQKNRKLCFSLLSLLIFSTSLNSFAMEPYSYGVIKNPLARYGKIALVGSKLIPPLYHSARNKIAAKGRISNLVGELHGNRVIPSFNQNQDIIVGMSLIDDDLGVDKNATESREGSTRSEDANASLSITTSLSGLSIASSSLHVPRSSPAHITGSRHITTTTNTAADGDANTEEPSDEHEASHPFFGNSLGHVPDELILDIFSYLTLGELASSAAVSRDWCRIANDDIVWKGRISKDFTKQDFSEFVEDYQFAKLGERLDHKKVYITCWFVMAIAGAVRAHDFDRVKRLFDLIKKNNLVGANACAACISVAGRENNFFAATRIFDLAKVHGMMNGNVYATYITAASRDNNFAEVTRTFDLSKSYGVMSPNIYAAQIWAAGRNNDFAGATNFFNLAQVQGMINANVYATYISVAYRTKNLSEAISTFELANKQGRMDDDAYEACKGIVREFSARDGEERDLFDDEDMAEELAREMAISLEEVTNFTEATSIFELAQDDDMTNGDVYAAQIWAANRTNNFSEATRLFNLAYEQGTMNADVYIVYINVADMNNNFAEAQRAFELAENMGLLDAEISIAYIRVLAKRNHVKEAARAFDFMLNKNMLNTNICLSYIEMCLESIMKMCFEASNDDATYIRILKEAHRVFNLAYERDLVDRDIYIRYLTIISIANNTSEKERICGLASSKNLDLYSLALADNFGDLANLASVVGLHDDGIYTLDRAKKVVDKMVGSACNIL